MRFITNNCTDPWWNMALDEWFLQNGPDEPVFWLWRNAPSVIIGYNQVASAEVNLEYLRSHGIKLARRVTGGGAVYHDLQNLNYSFAGPIGSVGPEIFVQALLSLGLPAELTGRNDVFVEGRKVSGYARSLYKNRELVHGTLMYNVDIDTLTNALNVEGSKLARKGVESVRSRVVNIRDYLPQYPSLDAIQSALHAYLAALPAVPSSPQTHGPAGSDASALPVQPAPLVKLGSTGLPGSDLASDEILLPPAQLAEISALASTKFASPSWIFRM